MTDTLPAAASAPATTAIRVRGLTARTLGRILVDGIDLDIPQGVVTALIGASGSGKTTTALALLGEHRPGVEVTTTEVHADGVRFGYVPQQPSSVLNPALRIGTVLGDIARAAHRHGHRVSVPDALQRAGFPENPGMLRRYPHQLSGGQQQRLVIAQALLTDPTCLILDEPTTGQDPINRAAILDEILRLRGQGLTIVLVTHDLDAVHQVAEHVIVMAEGRVIDTGDTTIVPAPAKSQSPRAGAAARNHTTPAAPRLELNAVTAGYRTTPVLHGFSLSIDAGECVALVGRSGCGKSTAARVAAGLHPPTAGGVLLGGVPVAGSVRRRARDQVADIAYVFQDAKAAFDPYRSVWEQIVRGPTRLRGATERQAAAAARRALEQVGLHEQIAHQRPGALSGGEAQRAVLARALAAAPTVLICDEITTGLDPISQRRVLDVLADLTRSRHLALLVISHDADVVDSIADRVVDLHSGTTTPDASGSSSAGNPATVFDNHCH
ncbi:ABC transporter ATP-binding protein [Rhodococcus sp. MSC1_016]|jgi:peptide/nickel transport system ATP-binding protein|uniref:ABC transporter ATP-binding protein n=1 Tax=Rhodococcus sp. MSC1_016 TaxID=2909266 RepID=UPI00202FD4D6|nr:ATP-binding cassette domain-containing protein [Rhodococcus sp. MSC1_016]